MNNSINSMISLLYSQDLMDIEEPNKDHIVRVSSFGQADIVARKSYLHSKLKMRPETNWKHEAWVVPTRVEHIIDDSCEISRWDNMSLIRVVVSCGSYKGTMPSPFAYDTFRAYETLFSKIKTYNLGNLVRIWNYIPNILKTLDSPDILPEDREKYRQFNAGRMSAWESDGPKDSKNDPIYPAATCMGTAGGPIVIEALVTHNTVIHIENPRQVAAYDYPKLYGTKAPAFSRGSALLANDEPEIYISGTGSIKDSNTVHLNDPAGQVKEIFENINTLINKENMQRYNLSGFNLKDLTGIRVYIKNRSHYPIIRKLVEDTIGQNKTVLYVKNDFCRPDLLLEIEAIARKNIDRLQPPIGIPSSKLATIL